MEVRPLRRHPIWLIRYAFSYPIHCFYARIKKNMRSIIFHFRKLDWILIISTILLSSIGLLSLYSSSIGSDDFLNFQKQLIFLGVGLFLMFLFSLFNYRILRDDQRLILIIYAICLLALIGLFFFAPAIRGVRNWYKIGPISIDPAEFVKLALLLLLAKYFSIKHTELYRMRHILLSGFYVFLPALLISLQPNLGSAMVLLILWAVVLIVSGIEIKRFFILCLCGLAIFVLSWLFFLRDYQKERIIGFVVPQFEPLGAGWNQAQARIAIGVGGLLGEGFAGGSQTQYGFLPEPQTDFIFSAIAEEFGLAGVFVILALLTIIITRIIKIALLADSNFPRLFSIGFTAILVSQVFINIGMNLGLLPVVGIPLPLVSYGGSSLITTFIGLGLALSIRLRI